jgi:hypothetical protein
MEYGKGSKFQIYREVSGGLIEEMVFENTNIRFESELSGSGVSLFRPRLPVNIEAVGMVKDLDVYEKDPRVRMVIQYYEGFKLQVTGKLMEMGFEDTTEITKFVFSNCEFILIENE